MRIIISVVQKITDVYTCIVAQLVIVYYFLLQYSGDILRNKFSKLKLLSKMFLKINILYVLFCFAQVVLLKF